MRNFERLILAVALVQLGACERPERTHNDGNQPSGKDPESVSSSQVAPSQRKPIEAQRNNAGAEVGMPKPSASTPVSGTPDADANPPRDPAAVPAAAGDASQSAGPSAAGRVDAPPADAARTPAQTDAK